MGPNRFCFVSVIVVFLVVATKQTNSEHDEWPKIHVGSLDLLSQGGKESRTKRGIQTGNSQSAFTKCPPCPHRKGPRAPVCEATVELGFVVESTSSIDRAEPDAFRRLIQFVALVARKFSVSKSKARIGLVTYSSSPKLVFPLTGNIPSAVKGLHKAKLHRDLLAKTGAALTFSYYKFFSRNRRFNKVLVVITDGSSSDSVSNIAKAIKRRGIKIIAVGVGRYFDIHQLNSMASRPVENHVFMGQFNKIIHTRNEVVKTICHGVGGSYISPCKRPCLCKTG